MRKPVLLSKRVRLATGALVLAVVAAACGGGGGSGGTDDQAATKAAVADPNAELRVGFTEDQYLVAGPRITLGTSPLHAQIYETLLYMDEKYEVKPRLAERYEFRPPNTWRFYLRRGVTFHDGQPFNAQAVKIGLFDRLAKESATGSTIRSGPDAAVVVDEYTIDFTPVVPNVRVPEQIVHASSNGVFAPGSNYATKPIGTGPFRFVEYVPKERIVVERNPTYWGEKAGVAKITFRFFPDSNARVLALQAGDLDAIFLVPHQDARGLEEKGFTVVNSTVGTYEAMYLNFRGEAPFDILKDVNVRKAVALGINRDSLVSNVLEGRASKDQTFIPPQTLGRHAGEVKGFSYNLNQAKTMLDQAGWRPGSDGIRVKDGRRMKLTLVSGFPSAEIHRPIPTFLQSEFKNLGIELEIVERPDSASFYDLMKEKKGDLWLEQGNQNDANPGFLPVLLFYTGPGSSGSGNIQGISSPGAKFDEILSTALTEVDFDKTRNIVARAIHEMVDEQVAVIPLAGIFRIYGMRKGVMGFTPHPSFANLTWGGVTVAAK